MHFESLSPPPKVFRSIRSDVFGKYLFGKFQILSLKNTFLLPWFYDNYLNLAWTVIFRTRFFEQIITEHIGPDALITFLPFVAANFDQIDWWRHCVINRNHLIYAPKNLIFCKIFFEYHFPSLSCEVVNHLKKILKLKKIGIFSGFGFYGIFVFYIFYVI